MADQSRLNEKENVDLAQSINEDVSASTVFVSKENSPDESDQSRVEPPEDGETTKAVIEKDMEKPTVASSSSSAAAPAPKGSKESCPACFVNTIDSVLRRITKYVYFAAGDKPIR
ncbi:hypothetical protein KEM55_005394 [Ascosphaera atra]|nr:hypothetical protein KEM55_005394 [Ascosphaera atra]